MNVTVIGIGRLGLCVALCIERSGYNVLGVDISEEYVNKLNDKSFKTTEPLVTEFLTNSKNFRATTNLKEGLDYSDIYFIIVDTPNGGGKNFYDHSKLGKLLSKINRYKVSNKHIVICCTIMPGYIDKIGKLLIKDCMNTTLNYNPEFIAQGNIISGLINPDIILIGSDNIEAAIRIEDILEKVSRGSGKFCRVTPLEAEIAKIAINGFITMKIAYANTIGNLCTMMGANPNFVLNAVGSDSRIGNKYFKYGNSYGGPCFPRDVHALTHILKENKICSSLMEATDSSNKEHIKFCMEILPIQEEYIFTEVSYKEGDVPIIEESHNLKLAELLALSGYKVTIKTNPELTELVKTEYGTLFNYDLS